MLIARMSTANLNFSENVFCKSPGDKETALINLICLVHKTFPVILFSSGKPIIKYNMGGLFNESSYFFSRFTDSRRKAYRSAAQGAGYAPV
jgi:hypothetical protein